MGNNTAEIDGIPVIDLEHSVIDHKNPSSIFPAIWVLKTDFLKIIECIILLLRGKFDSCVIVHL